MFWCNVVGVSLHMRAHRVLHILSEACRYSQMKWLASLEGKQFRTLSPGRGLPSRGLVRHIGSQIANADKVIQNESMCSFALLYFNAFLLL